MLETIQDYDGYETAYLEFSSTYYVTLLISVFIPCFVFTFLIPVLVKGNKTIGMLITKTSLANDGTNVRCKPARVAARFFTIYAIEYALAYAVGQLLGLGFIVLVNILTICFTKKKKAIHDLLTKCHVEKDEFTYTD